MSELFDCRDAFADTLISLAESDKRIVAVVNDSVGSSKLGGFQERFPDRLINVGIAEQAMVGVAAGLAAGGRLPFVSAASCFLTARAMEQIKVDIAYSQHHVVLCGQSPGVAYGELGPTHHSPEDLAWLRAIPGLEIVVPADPAETSAAVRWAAAHNAPVFLRISRTGVPALYDDGIPFRPGRAQVLREGNDVAIVALGTAVARALSAADELAQRGVAARVLAVSSLAPLDEDALVEAARATLGVVTVEEAYACGLGGAVAELLARRNPTPMRMLGLRGFAPTGSVEHIHERAGVTAAGISAACLDLVGDAT
jgi:transketolase